MTESYTKPNAALEKQIAACTTKEALADVLLRHQQANGLPNATDRVAISESASTWAEPSQVEVTPKEVGRSLRRAITLDDGTVKLIEADSFYGLGILEAAARGKRI